MAKIHRSSAGSTFKFGIYRRHSTDSFVAQKFVASIRIRASNLGRAGRFVNANSPDDQLSSRKDRDLNVQHRPV